MTFDGACATSFASPITRCWQHRYVGHWTTRHVTEPPLNNRLNVTTLLRRRSGPLGFCLMVYTITKPVLVWFRPIDHMYLMSPSMLAAAFRLSWQLVYVSIAGLSRLGATIYMKRLTPGLTCLYVTQQKGVLSCSSYRYEASFTKTIISQPFRSRQVSLRVTL